MLKTSGDLLQQERLIKGLTLEDVEKETRIRRKNLVAIEEGDWSLFPSRTYIQGIITSYGNFLNLDTEKLLAYFRREYEQRESMKFKTKATKEQFAPQTKKFLRLIVITILLLFATYFGYQLTILFRPPTIVIIEPKKTTFTKENKILLKGSTRKYTQITVNDERLYLDDQNFFETEIPLTREENKVTIKAIGANGQKKTVNITLFKKEVE